MKLRSVLNLVTKIVTNVIENKLPKLIKDAKVLEIVQVAFKPFQKVLLALTDSNPDNATQLKAIMVEHSTEVVDSGVKIITELVEDKVKDESLKAVVDFKLLEFKKFLKAVTDANPNDSEQIKELIELGKEPTLDTYLTFAKNKIEANTKIDEDIKDIVIITLEEVIEAELL